MNDKGLPEPHLLLNLPHNNQDNILKVKILQYVINKIIDFAGHNEGPALTGQRNDYPSIHLLEVLDPNNNTWIMRSEHFHLSRSPCVHNGLAYIGKINHFLKYLNLWPDGTELRFEAVTWLHTIAHSLDGLYCGKNLNLGSGNQYVFDRILFYFGIFLGNMTNGFPICGVIPKTGQKNKNYIQLFFYICMNDMNSIQRKLIRPNGNKDGVSDDFLIELKNTSNSQVPFAHGGNRQPLIDDIIARIKREFSPWLNRFPFFTHLYSYRPISGTQNFNIIDDCRNVKINSYNCTHTTSNTTWQNFNPNNIDIGDPTRSDSLYLNNYTKLRN
jgi:hypothetical protein